MMDQVTKTGIAEDAWKSLYRIGGAAALIAGIVFRRNLDAEFMLLRSLGVINAGPVAPPSTVMDWFALLQNHPLIGLTLLNLFDLVNYALVGMMFLALCVALRQTSVSGVAIAATLSFIGITIYFASNHALDMLSLSGQYAAAMTDAQRSTLLAAGQATLVIHNSATYQGTGIYLSFLFVTVAGLMISIVMLWDGTFNKATSYVGILANGFGLGYYITLACAPAMVAIPISVSAVFLLAWYILVGCRLWTFGSTRAALSSYRGASRKKDVPQPL